MTVIDLSGYRQKIAEEKSAEVRFVPKTFFVEVTLFEDAYGIKIDDVIENSTDFSELAASMIKGGAKMLIARAVNGDPPDAVAFGFIYQDGSVCAWNGEAADMDPETEAWFAERTEKLRESLLKKVTKNDAG